MSACELVYKEELGYDADVIMILISLLVVNRAFSVGSALIVTFDIKL